MKKINEHGSAVIILFVLILIVVIIGAGYLVYSRQPKNNSQASSQENEQSLVVNEWGVKLNKPVEISDLTYEDYGSSDELEWIRLTSPSLEANGTLTIGGPETTEKMGLIYRAKSGAKAGLVGCGTNEECADKNGWAHKTINGYFYYYDPTHSSDKFFNTSLKTSVDKAVNDTLSAN